MRCRIALTTLVMALALAACGRSEDGTRVSITVFAAASTSDVIREAARRFEAETDTHVVVNADASSRLVRQIMAGAAADVILSANQQWMDELEQGGFIVPNSRTDILRNELVLIAPRGCGLQVEVSRAFDFATQCPEVERVALADPAHVPAGQYAQEALKALGWWDAIEPRVIPAENVRAALRLAEIGEVDAAIVYATDARISSHVDMIASFPPELHRPITYPIARCSDSPAAILFIEFLQGEAMRDVFEAAGFGVVQSSVGEED